LNHEDRKDRKEKMLAHLAAEQFDRVMDKVGIQHMIWLNDNLEAHRNIFFAVFEVFAVYFCIALFEIFRRFIRWVSLPVL
jgi:hypothetical protein